MLKSMQIRHVLLREGLTHEPKGEKWLLVCPDELQLTQERNQTPHILIYSDISR